MNTHQRNFEKRCIAEHMLKGSGEVSTEVYLILKADALDTQVNEFLSGSGLV
jgi:hypothetical protein